MTDIIARTHAAKLAELWGQSVVVENRPGAGGSLGAAVVARAPADGYMLLVHSRLRHQRRGESQPALRLQAVVERINRDVMRIMDMPEVLERFSKLGTEPMRMTSAEFGRFVKSEIEDSARIAQAAGIKAQ